MTHWKYLIFIAKFWIKNVFKLKKKQYNLLKLEPRHHHHTLVDFPHSWAWLLQTILELALCLLSCRLLHCAFLTALFRKKSRPPARNHRTFRLTTSTGHGSLSSSNCTCCWRLSWTLTCWCQLCNFPTWLWKCCFHSGGSFYQNY